MNNLTTDSKLAIATASAFHLCLSFYLHFTLTHFAAIQKLCKGNFGKFQESGESRFSGSEKDRYFLKIPKWQHKLVRDYKRRKLVYSFLNNTSKTCLYGPKISENIEIEHVFQPKAFFHFSRNLHTSCLSAFNNNENKTKLCVYGITNDKRKILKWLVSCLCDAMVIVDLSSNPSFICEELLTHNKKSARKVQLTFHQMLISKFPEVNKSYQVTAWKLHALPFFFSGFSFTNIQDSRDSSGRGRLFFLSPLYHFHPLHRHLEISRAITKESLPLHIANKCLNIRERVEVVDRITMGPSFQLLLNRRPP